MKAPCQPGRAFAGVIFTGTFPVNRKSGNVRPSPPQGPANPFRPHKKARYSSFRGHTLQKPRFNKPWRDKKRSSDFSSDRSNLPLTGKGRRGDANLRPREDDGTIRLFGFHPVEAALKNPARRVLRLLLTENAERRLRDAVGPIEPAIERVTPRDLDKLFGPDTVHQGAALETEPLPEPDWQDLAEAANGRPLIVLDQVTDPHNVGAILRSSAVFGASGLVMTRRHSPPLNGVLA
ncbi:MAG: RNA methyltransferase substrate-binding domain-containing protein, partial [Hyphomicrobium sp.]